MERIAAQSLVREIERVSAVVQLHRTVLDSLRQHLYGEDDTAELSSFPLNRVRLGLSLLAYTPGEFVAAVDVAQANRELVAHEFAAMTGEDGRTAGEARTVLLALTGGEPSDEAALQEYGDVKNLARVACTVRAGR